MISPYSKAFRNTLLHIEYEIITSHCFSSIYWVHTVVLKRVKIQGNTITIILLYKFCSSLSGNLEYQIFRDSLHLKCVDPCRLKQCLFKALWKANANLLQTACVINDTTGTYTWKCCTCNKILLFNLLHFHEMHRHNTGREFLACGMKKHTHINKVVNSHWK